jgi:hypothetical protein
MMGHWLLGSYVLAKQAKKIFLRVRESIWQQLWLKSNLLNLEPQPTISRNLLSCQLLSGVLVTLAGSCNRITDKDDENCCIAEELVSP